MNRLQKKCFIASAGTHLSLALLLVIGPAFLAPSSKPVDVPVLNFIPYKTVDADAYNSGGPSARSVPASTPTPAPPVTLPTPPAPQQKPEDTPKDTVKDTAVPKSHDDSLEVSKKPLDLRPFKRRRDPDADAKAMADAEAKEQARQAEAARRRVLSALNRAESSIDTGTSSSTTVSLVGGDGHGSGVPYANFLAAVKSAYVRALVIPDSLNDDTATTVASVTIARDGTVMSSKIIRFSGDNQLDQAVQRTLDRVTYAAPLPDDAKENQRTVEINFNAKAKRGLG